MYSSLFSYEESVPSGQELSKVDTQVQVNIFPLTSGVTLGTSIDVTKQFFYIFIKNAFLRFFFILERFLFSSGQIFNPNKLVKLLHVGLLYIKRLLCDGFSMAAAGNSLMKSHSSQTLSCTL